MLKVTSLIVKEDLDRPYLNINSASSGSKSRNLHNSHSSSLKSASKSGRSLLGKQLKNEITFLKVPVSPKAEPVTNLSRPSSETVLRKNSN